MPTYRNKNYNKADEGKYGVNVVRRFASRHLEQSSLDRWHEVRRCATRYVTKLNRSSDRNLESQDRSTRKQSGDWVKRHYPASVISKISQWLPNFEPRKFQEHGSNRNCVRKQWVENKRLRNIHIGNRIGRFPNLLCEGWNFMKNCRCKSGMHET